MAGPDDDDARTFNRRAAENYDALTYTSRGDPQLDLERLFGLARLYGGGPEAPAEAAVLDLGCGVGVQLARAAGQTLGPLVGTDISAGACAHARLRLQAQAGRTRILAADALDLDPDSLGRFDAIYCIGVIYVVPPEVRERLFDLIGACLKPGGVAAISYYSGAMGALRIEVNRMLRRALEPTRPRAERVAEVRARMNRLAGEFQKNAPDLPSRAVWEMSAYTDDVTLFHEALCEAMVDLHTSEVAEALAARGLTFLSYLHPMPAAGAASAEARAAGADLWDLRYGGYRYAAFARPAAGGLEAPDAGRAGRWRSGLQRRPSPAPLYTGPGEFADPALGGLQVASPLAQAALDGLAQGPAGRAELLAGAVKRLSERGIAVPEDAAAVLDAELKRLWADGWLTPLAPAV